MRYNKVFFTASPSFYKTRLFNEIAKKRNIFVFLGEKGLDRNSDFYNEPIYYPHCFWPHLKIKRLLCFLSFFLKNEYDELVLTGWDNIEGWFAAIISPKYKNACLIESSIFESQQKGWRGFFKKLFLLRISKVYASGFAQEELVRSLGFKQTVVKFGGCGILRYVQQPPYEERKKVEHFLFIGRLVPAKNLKMLIEVFNELPELKLTIGGFGIQNDELKSISNSNINFLGAVDNANLPSIYKSVDVFVLPSIIEPWGLVIEEALNNGLPVIVSNHVGCGRDLVSNNTGIVFNCYNKDDLRSAILKMVNVSFYNKLRYNISNLDFSLRAKKQIECFL